MGDDSPQSEEDAGSDRPTGRQRVPGRALAADDVFEVLDSSRRRYLLSTLSERPEWRLDDLAERIAARETDAPVRADDEGDEEQVYASLYHVHVPLLADRGVVTFDPETDRVVADDRLDRMVAALVAAGEALDAAAESDAARGQGSDGGTEPASHRGSEPDTSPSGEGTDDG